MRALYDFVMDASLSELVLFVLAGALLIKLVKEIIND